MKNVVIKPLGKVLKQAGLISDVQIRTVLEIQSKNNQVKFGKIVVSQGILKQKTVDFFVEQFPRLLQQPTKEPLGYYLQKASLIDAQQIETLLEEQKQTKLLLGELVVEKGLLKEKTLKFFLQYLGKTENEVQLLSPSYQELIKSLHLETKAASPYSLLKEIFFWTGGHPLLTREICRIISDAKYFISDGSEEIFIKQLIKEYVIRDWEIKALGGYLKTIQYYLLNNTICPPRRLLRQYLQILEQGEIQANQSQEQQELIKLGLIVKQENKLKVSNRIYQSIFNSDWVHKQLSAQAKKLQTNFHKARKTTPRNEQISTATQIENEPLSQIGAFIVGLGLLFIAPLVIVLNNSQDQPALENDNLNAQSLSQSTLCVAPITSNLASQDDWRLRLQQEQQNLQQQFPDNCQRNLDNLIVLNALKLGKENRVLEGINNLCQISVTSESFNQAQFWLSRWYNSADWGEQTKTYLNSISDCPAAKFNY